MMQPHFVSSAFMSGSIPCRRKAVMALPSFRSPPKKAKSGFIISKSKWCFSCFRRRCSTKRAPVDPSRAQKVTRLSASCICSGVQSSSAARPMRMRSRKLATSYSSSSLWKMPIFSGFNGRTPRHSCPPAHTVAACMEKDDFPTPDVETIAPHIPRRSQRF